MTWLIRRSVDAVFLAAALALLAVPWLSGSGAPDPAPVPDAVHSAPLLSPDETAAIEEFQGEEREFILGMTSGPYCFYREDGTMGGYSVLLCQWLTDQLGLTFKPVIYPEEKQFQDEFPGKFYVLECDPEQKQPEFFMTDPLVPVYSHLVLATRNPELAPIITAVNKYLAGRDVQTTLADRYVTGNREYRQYLLMQEFTSLERTYLATHQNTLIPILVEVDNYPVSFYDNREHNWEGIALDVLHDIEGLTGLHFQPVNNPTETNFTMLLKSLVRGEGALLTQLVKTPARRDYYIWANEPYHQDRYAFLSRTVMDPLRIDQVLGVRVGLIKDSIYTDLFHELFPSHHRTSEYPDEHAAFTALENKEVDLVMASRNMLLAVTNLDERPGFKVNLLLDQMYDSYFGFNSQETLLCTIVSKAQRLVNTRRISDNWIQFVFDYREKINLSQTPYMVGLFILMDLIVILLAVMLIKNRQIGKYLETTILERTEELEVQSKIAEDRASELEYQTRLAKVASQAKSDFLARISHEIRTPLNAIMGMTVIARRTATSPKTRESLDQITTASTHLLAILNDVLDMSKIESGKFVLVHEPFLLRTAMTEVVNIIAPRCREKKIRFIANVKELPDLAVIGDKLRLKQVLINLLGNSVKFTAENGTLALAFKTVDDENLIALTCQVIDNGIGMSPDQLKKIFTPFEQADHTISARFGGTGLGLSISQNLIQQMGGMIEARSRPGEGSTFYFTINLEKTSYTPQDLNPEADAHLDLSGKCILLVEDVDINRMILGELLEDTHVTIEEAADGQIAVNMFSNSALNHYDLIFMDIQMPNMDGYEAAATIRALPRADAHTVPIIAMTANAYREDVDKALSVGMNGHVAKPIDMNTVLRILRERLT